MKPPFPILQRGHPQAQLLSAGWPVWEGSGTTLHDLNGNDGTLTGGVTWADGPFGKCLKLNGTTGYVSLVNPARLPQGATARTIIGLFSDLGTPANNQSFFNYGDSGAGVSVRVSAGGGEISVAVNGHRYGVTGLSLGSGIHNLAVVFPAGQTTSDKWQFYLDGMPLAASTLSGSVQTVNTGGAYARIGANDTIGLFQTGVIDCFKIYPYALSASQIAADYADSFAYCRPRRRAIKSNVSVSSYPYTQASQRIDPLPCGVQEYEAYTQSHYPLSTLVPAQPVPIKTPYYDLPIPLSYWWEQYREQPLPIGRPLTPTPIIVSWQGTTNTQIVWQGYIVINITWEGVTTTSIGW